MQYVSTRPNSITSVQADQEKEQREIWYSLLLTITKIELGLTASAVPFWLMIYFVTNLNATLFGVGILVFNSVLSVIRLFMLRSKQKPWLEIATAEAVVGHLLTVSLATALVGASSGIVSMFFWAPVLIAILGLSLEVIIATTVVTTLVMVVGIVLQSLNVVKPPLEVFSNIPVANIFLWSLSLLLVVVGLIVFARRLRSILNQLRQRAVESEASNIKLSDITLVGSQLSQKVNSVSAELTATSNQQASGASQQSEAVVAATTSLEELSQSAFQIAENAQQVAGSVAKALEIARNVRGISEQTELTAEQGKAAVEATIGGFERVSQRIELLAQHLMVLTDRSKQIGAIIDLLDGIADETHLLALNAAIESAGAGEAGQRFGVVAVEVKNLADRSVKSTKEVRQIISDLQGAVAAAVLTAEEGRKEASRAAERAYQSGQVIERVNQAVVETSNQGAAIVQYAEHASRLAEEISLATNQQRSASDQVVFTIRQVKQVAGETATSSRYVAESARQLSELTFQLASTLNLDILKELKPVENEPVALN